jgi:tryptophan synthase beta chain
MSRKDNIPYKIYLNEEEIPKAWYNVRADMKTAHRPILHPGTLKPVTEDDLRPVFCDELVRQELNDRDSYIEIPEPVRDFYRMYRPSPVVRARFLEKALGTPARIYYKYEGGNTSGSHKLNSAIAQAYYAKDQGLVGVTTETGAGQWGTALSMACGYFDLDCLVYMVKVSAQQKPYRKTVMETYGAKVTPSPSDTTNIGRKMLADNPETTGSLGCAISEAVETAVSSEGYKYVLGSVLNQVLIHQSVIGLEAKAALEKYDEYPDILIGCAGGGSNLGGLMAPFMADRLAGRRSPRFIAVEPASCPSLTRGRFAYDFCDTGKVTPLAKMYTLGASFIPASNHAGGLRYHGMSPIISQLYHDGYLDEARAVGQISVFEAAKLFAKVEGLLPAPESAHAIRVTVDEALKCRESGEEKTIMFGLTGTGYFDLAAYAQYNDGTMEDYIPTDGDLERGFADLPDLKGVE